MPWGTLIKTIPIIWSVRAAVTYLRNRPNRVDELRDEADRDRELATT